jgi:enoyl-CoA hydratase/carnithine racemase/3-hydroxyacyl-CoA dehydrogenase
MTALRLDHEDGIAIVTIDLPGEPVNKVTAGLRVEFAELFGRIEGDTMVKGVVLISGKPDSWIAGADIDELLSMHRVTDAEALSKGAQALLARLESLRVPVVAAIHGACLGGGLEAALACHYRVATDHPKTVLALPEVQLGLIPGAGGTQRLPRLIGLQRALDMILTGRNIRAKKAYQMGLVDEVVHPAILREVAIDRARHLADFSLDSRHSPKGRGATGVLLEANPIGRSFVFRKAREGVMSKTHGHYPAPLAALAAVQAGYDGSGDLGYRMESRSFGELAMSDVAKELIFLFFATTALKKDPGIDGEVPEAQEIETLGVLGAGFMGAGIASIAVQQDTPVRLKDTDLARVGKGIAAVSEVLRERLKKKQITKLQYEDQMLLAGGTVDYTGFGRATLVIEAVDAALTAFGFPVGPITLLDEVGIDVGGKVGQVLSEGFGTRMMPSDSLRRVVESGRTGRKGRRGFYVYDEAGKKGEVDPSVYEVLPGGSQRTDVPAEEIQRRCVLAMVNEAALCLEERVLRSSRDGDVGAVFGLGFPPFRGGPFRYVDSQGAARVVDDLHQLNERFPGRFAPATVLVQHARAQQRFYPARGNPLEQDPDY